MEKRPASRWLALMAMVSVCGTAQADASEIAKKGQFELGAEPRRRIAIGSTTSTIQGTDIKVESTTAGIRVPVGYFVTDEVEVIGSVSYDRDITKVSVGAVSGTVTNTTTSYAAGAAYNFHLRRIIPFLEALVGGAATTSESSSSKTNVSATFVGFVAGFRVPLGQRVAVRLSAGYDSIFGGTLDLGGGLSGGLTGNVYNLNTGFSLFF